MEDKAMQSKKARRADVSGLTARPSKKVRQPAGSCLTPLALRLAKEFAKGDHEGKNLVFSPLSIYAALALVAAGARGETLDEFLTLLGSASRDELAEFVRDMAERVLTDLSGSGGPLIAYACGAWHAKKVKLNPAYRAAAVESYKAETHAADFSGKPEEARDKINNWVSKATNELVTSILPKGSVHCKTALVVANCIYFKGKWSKPFAKKDTKVRPFYRLDGSHVSAPFMHSQKDQFVMEYDGFKVLKLPYQMQHDQQPDESSGFSMCVFLPDARDGLPSLLDKMASSPSFLQDHMPRRSIRVGEFSLPKFKFSFFVRMNDVLKGMGIKAAFKDSKADFSDMLKGHVPLTLEHVFHKAVLEVNEEGTEAAASTACTLRYKCKPRIRKPVDFVADHPSAFFMVEEGSGAVVFMGNVLDPTGSE